MSELVNDGSTSLDGKLVKIFFLDKNEVGLDNNLHLCVAIEGEVLLQATVDKDLDRALETLDIKLKEAG